VSADSALVGEFWRIAPPTPRFAEI